MDAFVSFLGVRNSHPPKCKWMATSDDISTLEKKTVVELKAELRVRGLTVSGPKSKLIESQWETLGEVAPGMFLRKHGE